MQCAVRYSVKILRSRLSLRTKLDAVLCLGTYFLPLLVGLSWILSVAALFMGVPLPLWTWTISAVSVFSVLGNFAPVFEVASGAWLEGSRKALLWLPLLPLMYVVNVIVCAKALADLALRKPYSWNHTRHNGSSHFPSFSVFMSKGDG